MRPSVATLLALPGRAWRVFLTMSTVAPSSRRFYLLIGIVASAIVFWPDVDIGPLTRRWHDRWQAVRHSPLLTVTHEDTLTAAEPPVRVPDWLYARRFAARGMLVYRAAASTPPNPIAWRFAYVIPVARATKSNGALLLDTTAFPRVASLFDSATTFQGLGLTGVPAGIRIGGQDVIQRALRYRRQGYEEDAACFPTLRVAVPRGPELVGDAPIMLGLRAGWADAVRTEPWSAGAGLDSARSVDEGRRLAALASRDTIVDMVRVPFKIISVEHASADGSEVVLVQAERRAMVKGQSSRAATDSVPFVEFLLALAERGGSGGAAAPFVPVWVASLVSPSGVATDVSPTTRLALLRAGQPRRLTLVTETRELGKELKPMGQIVVRGDDAWARWRVAGTWRESGCW